MPREEECISTLREMRWPDGVIACPRCGSDRVVKDGPRGRYQMYWCKKCNFGFNDRSGTIFQDTKVPLRKWFMMAFMMQFRVSVLEISKTIGVSYRHSYYMARKIRGSVYAGRMAKKLKGTVEVDELYVTAGLKGKKEGQTRQEDGAEGEGEGDLSEGQASSHRDGVEGDRGRRHRAFDQRHGG
ncbi:MAG: IS1 family transposase [Nitrososphaerota archaeon]|nr:IS1 family transposase [Nitrososphaerota archaeon]MDG7028301.1 IS1 family transposase [Nitrososphaerota archaeon]